MVELASRDDPAALCLQEVPVWALDHLEDWSGMTPFWSIARPPRKPELVAGWLTRRHNGFFRSRLAGQANAILVRSSLHAENLGGTRVSNADVEPRVVHAVRIDEVGLLGNLHATNAATAPEIPRAETVRAGAFLDRNARPDEIRILAGDFNHHHPHLPGYENGGPGLDHILVAGGRAEPLVVWPDARRVQDQRLLSDHAPVERTLSAGAGASSAPITSLRREGLPTSPPGT